MAFFFFLVLSFKKLLYALGSISALFKDTPISSNLSDKFFTIILPLSVSFLCLVEPMIIIIGMSITAKTVITFSRKNPYAIRRSIIDYLGAILMPPSKRIVSPFRNGFSTMCLTNDAYS